MASLQVDLDTYHARLLTTSVMTKYPALSSQERVSPPPPSPSESLDFQKDEFTSPQIRLTGVRLGLPSEPPMDPFTQETKWLGTTHTPSAMALEARNSGSRHCQSHAHSVPLWRLLPRHSQPLGPHNTTPCHAHPCFKRTPIMPTQGPPKQPDFQLTAFKAPFPKHCHVPS